MIPDYACPLCLATEAADTGIGVTQVYRNASFRVIRVEDEVSPAFYRLIWQRHAAEFSDLSEAERVLCMQAVSVIESTMRTHLQPTKINLASLGNYVAHLHWHIIARYDSDSHYPDAVWAQCKRPANRAKMEAVACLLPALDAALSAQLMQLPQLSP